MVCLDQIRWDKKSQGARSGEHGLCSKTDTFSDFSKLLYNFICMCWALSCNRKHIEILLLDVVSGNFSLAISVPHYGNITQCQFRLLASELV